MILIEKTEVMGFEQAIRGMRNPMNSWDKSDSGICKGGDDGIGCSNCAAFDCEHSYDQLWICTRKLKEYGVDLKEWYRQRKE